MTEEPKVEQVAPQPVQVLGIYLWPNGQFDIRVQDGVNPVRLMLTALSRLEEAKEQEGRQQGPQIQVAPPGMKVPSI
jgi:hypothetical protein